MLCIKSLFCAELAVLDVRGIFKRAKPRTHL